MSFHFRNFTALALTMGIAAGASSAHADTSYMPYYFQNRDSLQYISATPPQTAGVPMTTQSNPGQPTSWQQAAVTNRPTAAAQTDTWHADSIDTIRASNSILWFSAGAQYFNYKESLPSIPDSERGWLPSMAVGASYMNHNNWFFSGEGNVSFGDADYNGALQEIDTNTNTIIVSPYQTTTHETIVNLDGKIGKGFEVTNRFMLTPYGDLGLFYWDRNILGSYGYVEDYTHYSAMAGLMGQIAMSNRLVLTLDGSYGVTFGSKMKTQDVPDFHIGSTGMYKVGSKISYALTPRFDIFTTMDFTHFRNVNSELQPDLNSPVPGRPGYYYAVQEPSSFTNEMATRIGIAYHFK